MSYISDRLNCTFIKTERKKNMTVNMMMMQQVQSISVLKQ
jgi:hypothetical protein